MGRMALQGLYVVFFCIFNLYARALQQHLHFALAYYQFCILSAIGMPVCACVNVFLTPVLQ